MRALVFGVKTEPWTPPHDANPLSVDGHLVPLVWRAHYVAAVLEPPDSTLSKGLEKRGFEVVVLGTEHAAWPDRVAALAKLFGTAT